MTKIFLAGRSLFVDFFLPEGLKREIDVDVNRLLSARIQILSFNMFILIPLGVGLLRQLILNHNPFASATIWILFLVIGIMISANLVLKYRNIIVGHWIVLLILLPLLIARFYTDTGILTPGIPALFLFPLVIFMMGRNVMGNIAILISISGLIMLGFQSYVPDGSGNAPYVVVYCMFTILFGYLALLLRSQYESTAEMTREIEQVKVARNLMSQLCHEINNPLQIAMVKIDLLEAKGVTDSCIDEVGNQMTRISELLRKVSLYSSNNNLGELVEKNEGCAPSILKEIDAQNTSSNIPNTQEGIEKLIPLIAST